MNFDLIAFEFFHHRDTESRENISPQRREGAKYSIKKS